MSNVHKTMFNCIKTEICGQGGKIGTMSDGNAAQRDVKFIFDKCCSYHNGVDHI